MRSWWSPLASRLAVVREVQRRGDTALFTQSFGFALATPVLMLLPLPYLDALLDWALSDASGEADADPDAIATTVLQMLEVGQPLVRRGCLTRGLTLYYYLRRAGFDAELSFGMGRAEGGDGFDGHCWISLNGATFHEKRDPHPHYVTMYTCRRGARAGGLSPSRA